MSKPLAGKRYFHALGERMRARYPTDMLGPTMRLAGMARVPLWAQNGFVDGWFGVKLRRRPAWTESGNTKFSASAAERDHN